MRSPRPTLAALSVLVLALLGGAPTLVAQSPVPAGRRQMVGFVRDAKGGPLEGVTVEVHGQKVTTDPRGAFALLTKQLDTASISVKRVGFEPIDAFITARNGMWDTVVVQLESATTTLAEVTVVDEYSSRAGGLRGFEERRRLKLGQYVTREEIAERGEQKLSEVLRTRKGVQVVRGRVRFAAFVGGRGVQCQPNVYLDGARAPGMEVDEILANTVQAIELYPYMSTLPIEFQTIGAQTTPCGTIVIWTRVPNSKSK
jgi:hypothetical protein